MTPAFVPKVRDTGGLDTLELSTALWCATAFRGGSAQLVQRLINSRAEVDFQFLGDERNPKGLYGSYTLIP